MIIHLEDILSRLTYTGYFLNPSDVSCHETMMGRPKNRPSGGGTGGDGGGDCPQGEKQCVLSGR